MHIKKKRKLLALYSIPINLCKRLSSVIRFSSGRVAPTRRRGCGVLDLLVSPDSFGEGINGTKLHKREKYLVSYSIPLSCMVVLLLGGIVAINPSLPLKTSAVTIQDEWVVKEKDDSSSDINNIDESSDTIINFNNSLSDADAGISPMSIVTPPTLGITVSNSNQTIDAVQGGNTVYGSYNISLTGSNVKDYTLSIKADSVNLVAPSQASTTTTVGGAGGKTGNTMTANTWGYKLTETSTAESSYGTLNYASLSTSLQQIANGTVSSPYNLSMNKKLVFAAKFKDDAVPGTYKGHITLSAVANQAVVGAIWSSGLETNITDMQDIKSGFCASGLPTGATITLKDNRGTSPVSYKIVKLKDGQCWMQENLRLPGGTTLKPSDSDVSSDWTLPASSDSSWSSTNTVAQMRTGKSGMTVSSSNPGDGNGWQSNYGNYYSWCAATAGTCSESTSDGGNVSGSICPKNWHLPTGKSGGEFYTLLNGLSNTTVIGSLYNYPYAGYIRTEGLRAPGAYGYYWSSTSISSSSAYALYFGSDGGFYPGTDSNDRYRGFSVRCVADY